MTTVSSHPRALMRKSLKVSKPFASLCSVLLDLKARHRAQYSLGGHSGLHCELIDLLRSHNSLPSSPKKPAFPFQTNGIACVRKVKCGNHVRIWSEQISQSKIQAYSEIIGLPWLRIGLSRAVDPAQLAVPNLAGRLCLK